MSQHWRCLVYYLVFPLSQCVHRISLMIESDDGINCEELREVTKEIKGFHFNKAYANTYCLKNTPLAEI